MDEAENDLHGGMQPTEEVKNISHGHVGRRRAARVAYIENAEKMKVVHAKRKRVTTQSFCEGQYTQLVLKIKL